MTKRSAKKSKKLHLQESKNSRTRDCLSDLPDSLIYQIFSFLPMEYVIRTTVLSKRWKGLWKSVPCLNFQSVNGREIEKFKSFVYRGTKIRKLTIQSNYQFDESLCCDLRLWIGHAVEHKVEELCLDIYTDDIGYQKPQQLFSSSSIRKLKISCDELQVHGNIHWNNLKSLEIEDRWLNQPLIDEVLSEALNIRSASLKKLSVRWVGDYFVDRIKGIDSPLEIFTPNLQSLKFYGTA